ncbi:hypothetical protein BST61_g1346 [Cercospora zeina]
MRSTILLFCMSLVYTANAYVSWHCAATVNTPLLNNCEPDDENGCNDSGCIVHCGFENQASYGTAQLRPTLFSFEPTWTSTSALDK